MRVQKSSSMVYIQEDVDKGYSFPKCLFSNVISHFTLFYSIYLYSHPHCLQKISHISFFIPKSNIPTLLPAIYHTSEKQVIHLIRIFSWKGLLKGLYHENRNVGLLTGDIRVLVFTSMLVWHGILKQREG